MAKTSAPEAPASLTNPLAKSAANTKKLMVGNLETYELLPNPETSMHIPPVDPDWLINTNMKQLILGIDANMNILLTGDAGVGKTTLVQQMAAMRSWPFTRIPLSEGVKESDLFGRWRTRDRETVWIKGPVQTAVEQGHILLLDEIDFADPSHLVAMRGLLEPDHRMLRLMGCDGSVVKAHPQLRICATCNSIGNANRLNYSGANMMNLADLDRFDWTIKMGHLDPDKEISLIMRKVPSVEKAIVEGMVKVAGLVRKANKEGETSYPFGLRAMLKWARAYRLYPQTHVGFALQGAVLDSLDPHEATFVKEIYKTVFGKH
jgi:cobaltochelatase CobS